LKNVLYVPVFKRNLISIDSLCDQHYKTVFHQNNNKNKILIYNKKNKKIFSTYANSTKTNIVWTSSNKINFNKIKISDNNIITCSNISFNSDDDFYRWHRRFGHYNINNLKEKLNKIKINCRCKICALSKLKNFPFPSAPNKSKDIFERIYMDTVTIKTPSLYGNKYFLSILDDYSRYEWTIFMKNKREVYNKFIEWYNKIRNIFNKNIKYIHTDNGTDFNNYNFNKFCETNGIVHEKAIPHTPQQNERVERLHGILITNARAMLQDAKLNNAFWENAVSTSNYIHNRIPHKGNNNKIPYEVLFNEKMDYSKLRVFGCRVYFLVPKQFRKKLDNTSLPGIFIGYDRNTAAYRIYDTTNNKIVLSRSVYFFEDTPGNCPSPPSFPDFINLDPYYESGGNEEDKVIDFNEINFFNENDN